MNKLNKEVSKFLDGLNHPLRDEIENLRHIITNATNGLTENIKWNGPNYCYNDNDRIIQSKSKLLLWRENDRAIITFKNRFEIEKAKADLSSIVNEWILRAK